jgi:DnaJ family protein B protein 6
MMPSPLEFSGGGMGSSRMQTYSNGGNGGRWISQSWTSSTVNGVTLTKSARRDSEGNEHVTYRYPDGTERHTINGIEQSTSQPPRALALPPAAPPAPPASDRIHDSVPPPPYHKAVAQQLYRSHSSRHHGHPYDNPDDRRGERSGHRHGHERDRAREYEHERGARGYGDDRYRPDAQNGSSQKFWKP